MLLQRGEKGPELLNVHKKGKSQRPLLQGRGVFEVGRWGEMSKPKSIQVPKRRGEGQKCGSRFNQKPRAIEFWEKKRTNMVNSGGDFKMLMFGGNSLFCKRVRSTGTCSARAVSPAGSLFVFFRGPGARGLRR